MALVNFAVAYKRAEERLELMSNFPAADDPRITEMAEKIGDEFLAQGDMDHE